MMALYSYCLFCNTNSCEQIATDIQRRFHLTAYYPKIVQRKWVKGECREEIRTYLPGYVFMFAESPVSFFQDIIATEGVLRFLGNKEAGYVLLGSDRRFAEMIYSNHGTIGIANAYEIGKKVRLSKDFLKGIEGEIVKLDRRKGRAEIQIVFDDRPFRIWVGCDILNHVPE